MTEKLVLGTAQFGLDYGINNNNGRITFNQAKEIIEFAHESGIHIIDTANLYGESEEILGKIGVQDFDVTQF